jgi:DNA-binding IclR family transcriptional regulator
VGHVAEAIDVTRQGAYNLMQTLRSEGLVVRDDAADPQQYALRSAPMVFEDEIVERPGRAKVFACVRFP